MFLTISYTFLIFFKLRCYPRTTGRDCFQVPVCPLCSAPVPVARGTVPDLAVSAHIDQACRQKVKEKVFTNK